MSDSTQAILRIDGLELGLYRHGADVVVYVNQGGVCIFRKVVELLPGLAAESDPARRLAMLRDATALAH